MVRIEQEKLKERLEPIAPLKRLECKGTSRAAVTLILDLLGVEASLLLVKRTVRLGDPWSGQMAFPGGHMTGQDTTILDTAIRETREEVGINLLDHELLGTISEVRSTRRDLLVTPFVASLRTKVTPVLRKNELAEAAWIRLAELARTPVVRRRIKTSESELEVEGMPYRDEIIWGLTFRMICDFLSRLGDET